jgi:NADPH-dependent 2,4-dienoyl-CoA reductase/sulfur reductase-like enzyme/predicted acylesterase/phospholipase RssA
VPQYKRVDFLLLGGGLASASAAEALRAEGAKGRILMVSGGNHPPYNRPPLSKQIFRGGQAMEKLLVHTEAYYQAHALDTMLANRAIAVDTTNRIVHTDRMVDIPFDKLLIATGTRPTRVTAPGSTLPGVHYLPTLDDAEALGGDAETARRAVVLGGSFLGVEIAATLASFGIHVVLIEETDLLLPQLAAPELSAFFGRYCAEHGIEARVNDTIVAFDGRDRIATITTRSGETLPCDLAVIAIGVTPNIEFLRGSGIELGDGVVVDEDLETNVAGIFAAGDVASFLDPIFGERRRIEHWDNAVQQGRLAARNMLGQSLRYDAVSYFYSDIWDLNFVFLGSTSDIDERIGRGSLEDRSFALFYLKKGVLRAAFSMGRPAAETRAIEGLIRHRVDLGALKDGIANVNFALETLPTQTVLILQGGGALGAFECGVVKALEEVDIHPDVIAGVSIGAFNGAIIAANPGRAAPALESFWNDLAILTPDLPSASLRRALSSWRTILFGSPRFFRPHWLPSLAQFPWTWTSFYDTAPARELLKKYVDFSRLKESPVRLLVGAVNVETAQLEIFDSHADDLTVDHIMASGSLPPAFPWTTIKGKHYWDGGIISNSPLEMVTERCGSAGKRVFIVDLFANRQPLPRNLIEVWMRRDEIVYAERVRSDVRARERVGDFRKLVWEIMDQLPPEPADRLRQSPRFIRLMGEAAPTTITRIINEVQEGDPPFIDNDFSTQTIARHKHVGYLMTKRAIAAR